MKKLLALVLVTMWSASLPASSFDRIVGVGKDREKLTPELIEIRTRVLQDAQEFWLLRHPNAEEAPKRIMSYWPLFESAAASNGLDPMYLAAICYVESYGIPTAKSPTGPAGLCQFSRASAKEEGLVIKTTRKIVGYRQPTPPKGKKPSKRKPKPIPIYETTVIDERLDPAKIIPAAARRLARSVRTLGRIDLAIQEYHDGLGRVLGTLSVVTGRNLMDRNKKIAERLAETRNLITSRGISYPGIFFANTPYYRANVFNHLQTLRAKADFSPTYYFRVMKAYELLTNYRANPETYTVRFALHRNRFNNGIAPSRMWTFFSPEDVEKLKFDDLEAIQKAMGSRLVALPQPYSRYGILPRLTGESPIAQCDPKDQQHYIAAEEAAVGLMIYIANETRLLQGKNFLPTEVNSMVRHEVYQKWLQDGCGGTQKKNSNARTDLPTHTIGKAFDLPLKGKSAAYQRDLLFILSDLESVGMLAYIREGTQDTIHVVAHPEFEEFLRKVYRDATAQ